MDIPAIDVGSRSMKETFIYAYYETKKIGKINITALKKKEEKLVIVAVLPPNTTAIPTPALAPSALQTYLNGIYKGANVEFTITSDTTKFDLSKDGTAGLERSDESVFGKYSLEMRALKSHYMAQHPNYDKKANYIFVIPSFTGGGLDGFMVRGRSVGFIVSDTSKRVYAHELGHGVFGLEHTFPEVAVSTTNNLMDYGTGTHLTHEQWKIIHARKPAYSWFDSEEDGTSVAVSSIASLLPFKNNNNTPSNDADDFYTFIAASGDYLLLPANGLESVSFSTLDRYFNTTVNGVVNTSSPTELLAPLGSVLFFKFGGINYTIAGDGNICKSDATTPKYLNRVVVNSGVTVNKGIAGFLLAEANNSKLVLACGQYQSFKGTSALLCGKSTAGELVGTSTTTNALVQRAFIIDIQNSTTMGNTHMWDILENAAAPALPGNEGNKFIFDEGYTANIGTTSLKIKSPTQTFENNLDALGYILSQSNNKSYNAYVSYFTLMNLVGSDVLIAQSCLGEFIALESFELLCENLATYIGKYTSSGAPNTTPIAVKSVIFNTKLTDFINAQKNFIVGLKAEAAKSTPDHKIFEYLQAHSYNKCAFVNGVLSIAERRTIIEKLKLEGKTCGADGTILPIIYDLLYENVDIASNEIGMADYLSFARMQYICLKRHLVNDLLRKSIREFSQKIKVTEAYWTTCPSPTMQPIIIPGIGNSGVSVDMMHMAILSGVYDALVDEIFGLVDLGLLVIGNADEESLHELVYVVLSFMKQILNDPAFRARLGNDIGTSVNDMLTYLNITDPNVNDCRKGYRMGVVVTNIMLTLVDAPIKAFKSSGDVATAFGKAMNGVRRTGNLLSQLKSLRLKKILTGLMGDDKLVESGGKFYKRAPNGSATGSPLGELVDDLSGPSSSKIYKELDNSPISPSSTLKDDFNDGDVFDDFISGRTPPSGGGGGKVQGIVGVLEDVATNTKVVTVKATKKITVPGGTLECSNMIDAFTFSGSRKIRTILEENYHHSKGLYVSKTSINALETVDESLDLLLASNQLQKTVFKNAIGLANAPSVQTSLKRIKTTVNGVDYFTWVVDASVTTLRVVMVGTRVNNMLVLANNANAITMAATAVGATATQTQTQSACQVCPIIPPRTTQRVLTPATCQALLQLRNSTNNQLGINALCNKISSETTLKEVTDQLNTYQTSLTANAIANDFLNDIKPTTLPTRHISSNLNSNFGVEQLKAWKKLYTSGFETDFEYIRTLSSMSVDCSTPSTGTSSLNRGVRLYFAMVNGPQNVTISSAPNGGGTRWATFNSNIITTTAGTTGAWNEILNVYPLIPNVSYEVDSRYTFETDDIGRVKKVLGTLILADTINPAPPRNGNEQTNCSKFLKDGSSADDGGHMIGNQFTGCSEQINYFPQARAQNQSRRAPLGRWYAMEGEWKKVLNGQAVTRPNPIPNQPPIVVVPAVVGGQTVRVEITPVFDPPTSKRPKEFEVKYWYNNTLQTPANNSNYLPIIPN